MVLHHSDDPLPMPKSDTEPQASGSANQAPVESESNIDNNNNKRTIDDTSFLDQSNTKRPVTSSSPIMSPISSNTTNFESILTRKIDVVFDTLSNQIKDGFERTDLQHLELVAQLSEAKKQAAALRARVDTLEQVNAGLESRIAALESGGGTADIEGLTDRLVALETGDEKVDWSPKGPTNTSIIILGDSNTRGIKFGSDKGTLGAVLPGKTVGCMLVDDIIPDAPDLLTATHISISVGTNNLRKAGADPAAHGQAAGPPPPFDT